MTVEAQERQEHQRPRNLPLGETDRKGYVLHQQLRLLYRTVIAQAANIVNGAIAIFVLWDVMPRLALLGWAGAMAVVVGFRLIIWQRFWRQDSKDLEATHWANLFVIGSVATGALWGSASAVLLMVDSIPYHVFIGFIIAGMSAGAVASSAAYLPAVYAFLVPASVPLILAFLSQGNLISTAMGIMTIIFVGLVSMLARTLNRSIFSNINLQADNSRLIEDLSVSRDLLEERVKDRTAELEMANKALTLENTERARAESAVRESESQLKLITDNLPALILYVDKDFNYRFVNKTTLKWYKKREEEVVGKQVSEVIGKESFEKVLPKLQKALEGFPQDFEETLEYPDGVCRDIELHYLPHVSQQGKVEGLVALALDISERLEMQSHLQQAQKMQTLGQLTGGVAHDFNNLLGIVIGNLEILGEELQEDDPRRAFVDAAMNAGLRGADVTHRLLAFSRKQPLAPEVTDLNERITGLFGVLDRLLGESIEISTELDEELWRTQVDPNQLETALINLTVNSKAAMPDGGRLTIKTSNTQLERKHTEGLADVTPGLYVMVSVTDSGVGMPPDVAAQAFDPFFTTNDIGQGSGLGLSMVYGFVKQSGGHIEIDSEVGKGTTVRFFFPMVLSDTASMPAQFETQAQGADAGKTILVVEDDPELRRVVSDMLRSLHYEVIAAEDGQTALEIMDKMEHVDLLFTDVVLPLGMNGLELARTLREKKPDLKVLFTSGYSEQILQEEPTLDGSIPVVSKPYRKAELARRVKDALQGKAA